MSDDEVLIEVQAVVRRWNESHAQERLTVPENIGNDPGPSPDEPWYWAVVRPAVAEQRFAYHYVLNFLETELEEEKHLNVLLLPVEPPDG